MILYNLVALMPMRHNSERVPGKNYRAFGDGRPLYQHVLDSMVACKSIDKIVIDTDSPTSKEQCAEKYPDVLILDRPEHLRPGTTPMNEVLLHDMSQVPSRFYLQTHSTNPLLKSETINKAVETFLANYPSYDSLFSVTAFRTRLWDALTRAVNHNPAILLRTQDLPPFYEENSNIYIYEGEHLKKTRSRLGVRPFMFEMSPWEAIDIDEEINFHVAEVIFQRASSIS